MCMTVGYAEGRVALLAADTRRSAYRSDGTVERTDPGGKVAVCPAGALSATGDALLLDAVLGAVRSEQPGTMEAVRAIVRRVFAATAPGIRNLLPDSRPDATRFLFAGAEPVRLEEWFARGGTVRGGGAGQFMVSWPPEIVDGPVRTEGMARFVGALEGAKRLPQLVRAFAVLVDFAAAHAPTMSAELDLAVIHPRRTVRILAPAATIAAESDGEIIQRLHSNARAA